jgi:4'-phosphopantetheinyl transferase
MPGQADTATDDAHRSGGALPAQAWPGALPVLRDGLCVLAIDTAGRTRPEARRLARQAIRDVLAGLLAIAPEQVGLPATPGQAQRIVLGAAAAAGALAPGTAHHATAPCCSISHETQWSMVAISLHGAVGIDIMAPQEIDDWAALARDYLGPEVAWALAACPSALRADALAQAWTAREAALKCLGRPLTEWRRAPALHCHSMPLRLPGGLAGTLAWPA